MDLLTGGCMDPLPFVRLSRSRSLEKGSLRYQELNAPGRLKFLHVLIGALTCYRGFIRSLIRGVGELTVGQ